MDTQGKGKSPGGGSTTDLVEIPNLEVYFSRGYDFTKGNFLHQERIFKISYDDGNTLSWDGTPLPIPDGMRAMAESNTYESIDASFMETTSDYNSEFSASMKVEYTGVFFSSAANSSLLYATGLFQSTKRFNTLHFICSTLCNFTREALQKSDLTEAFVTHLDSLHKGSELPDHERDKYIAFFGEFGTHYVSTGSLGGYRVMSVSVEETLRNTNTVLEIAAGADAGFSGLKRSANMDIEAAYEASSFMEEHRASMSASLETMGGNYSDTVSGWVSSLYTIPILLLFTPPGSGKAPPTELSFMDKLVDVALDGASSGQRENVKTHLRSALGHMIQERLRAYGCVGSRKYLLPERQYETPDMAVLYGMDITANGDGVERQATFESNELSADLRATVQSSGSAKSWCPVASSLAPIVDDRVVGRVAGGSGGYIYDFVSYSMGIPPYSMLEAPREILNESGAGTVRRDFEAGERGSLLFGTYSGTNEMIYGHIHVYEGGVNENGLRNGCTVNLFKGIKMNGSSVFHVMAPNSKVTIEYRSNRSGSEQRTQAHVYQADVKEGYALGSPETRSVNTAYEAGESGFLTALLYCGTETVQRARLHMLQHRDDELVSNSELSRHASACVDKDSTVPSTHDNKNYTWSTGAMPVVKGNFYRADLQIHEPGVKTKVYFIPILEQLETIDWKKMGA